MASPMFDLPSHMLIPVNEEGNGPVPEDEAFDHVCWCGEPDCDEVTKDE